MRDGRREIGHLIEQTLARCDGAAQHGIDEPSHAGFSGLDRFIDRRMVGNAENEDLAKPDAQDIARFGVGLPIAEFADPVVEKTAVAQHAEEDRLQEPAVGLAQLATLRMAFDKRLGVIMALCPCP